MVIYDGTICKKISNKTKSKKEVRLTKQVFEDNPVTQVGLGLLFFVSTKPAAERQNAENSSFGVNIEKYLTRTISN